MTAREQSLNRIESSFQSIMHTLRERSKGYASDDDPFKNIRFAALSANISEERHMIAMIGHKLARIENLVDRPLEADNTGEKFLDSMKDLIGYTALFKDWMEEKIFAEVEDKAVDEMAVAAGVYGTKTAEFMPEVDTVPATLGDHLKKLLHLNGPVPR